MRIYENYDDEPEDVFLPLPENRYCDFYELEMGKFSEDLSFYRKHLPKSGNILELGCGTGRISRSLASPHRQLTGIDISLPMLHMAASHRNNDCRYIGMDMRRLAFRSQFDAALIPYNTINLLPDSDAARACLMGCHTVLKRGGILLMQIFVPQHRLAYQAEEKSFQFQILETAEKIRIIKEILRTFDVRSGTMHIEERYRVRPQGGDFCREDFSHHMTLSVPSAQFWFSLLEECNFAIDHSYGDYNFSLFTAGLTSCLLLAAHR